MDESFYLIINVGSTSVKTCLFDAGLQAVASLNAQFHEGGGLDVDGRDKCGQAFGLQDAAPYDAGRALTFIYQQWQTWLLRDGLKITAIGHRVVHGGENFTDVTLINAEVLRQIAELDQYAPLHNPLNRLGIQLAASAFPEIRQFAVFDTAFHRTIPEYAGRYAIPDNGVGQINFYRYGFHGISCQHSVAAASRVLGIPVEHLGAIILHLGGGASATAVKAGQSVDTSMGFSPTEGLVMSSRCGDLDPMVAITLQRQGMALDKLEQLLNKQSGLLGICGDADMRSILQKAGQGDAQAQLAVDLFCYRIKKYIGAYWAVLGPVPALIFTGGIGEHAPQIRENIVKGLSHLGFAIDALANQQNQVDISSAGSQARVLVIGAEEDREIARQINEFLYLFS